MQNPWISMQKLRKKKFFFEFSADVASYLSIAIINKKNKNRLIIAMKIQNNLNTLFVKDVK